MAEESRNFIEEIIDADLESGKVSSIVTRFPPEPNGYLHLGHAKAICLNFGLAKEYNGYCNLRFDDTNPVKEDIEYINSIKKDIEWLGFRWKHECYGSDYFEYMIGRARVLINKGLAYVCELTADEIRDTRGTLTEPGKESPYRNRSAEENMMLFDRMIAGDFADGTKVLRAKIDMASPNLNMRDPVIYRIVKAEHHRTGNRYCVYPMYDFAHPLEDAVEGITHSVCTLEFEDHRPLYDWFIENCECENTPHQYEFARLNVNHMIMSKRYLKRLVDDGVVTGWDDPRMPTLSGLRKRGYPPEAIHDFCDRIGVAKANSEVDIRLLEHCVRENLNANAERVMGVIDPVKVVITNYPEDKKERLTAENMPGGEKTHEVYFSREIFIEKDDFMEVKPNNKFFRLCVGGEVRLKNAYIIKCESVVKDEKGDIKEILCTYDPDSKTGGATADRKVKGTLHWADAATASKATVRLYDYLIDDDGNVNPESLTVREGALVEPYAAAAKEGDRFQFMRIGYFVCSGQENGKPVFSRIVSLKDSFAKTLK